MSWKQDGRSHSPFRDRPSQTLTTTATATSVTATTPTAEPFTLFWPEHYEPGYAYPLVVLLHDHGSDQWVWHDALPHLSRRNYAALALRGVQPLARSISPANAKLPAALPRVQQNGFGWGMERYWQSGVEDYVFAALAEAAEWLHFHPRKIFLLGFGEGASVAYHLGLSFPHRFLGIVAGNGQLPQGPLPLSQFRRDRQLRILQCVTSAAPNPLAASIADADYHLLTCAGVDVQRSHFGRLPLISPEVLRAVDRWLMQCCQLVSEPAEIEWSYR